MTAVGPRVTPGARDRDLGAGQEVDAVDAEDVAGGVLAAVVGVTVAIFGRDCTANRTTSSPSVGGNGVPSSLEVSTRASWSASDCQGAGARACGAVLIGLADHARRLLGVGSTHKPGSVRDRSATR